MVATQTSPSPDTTSFPNTTSYPSLYVGDLDPTVSEGALHDTFNKIGSLVSIRICRDRVTKNSLGYAYVNYTNLNDAERALETLNYSTLNGKQIRLMWSHRDPRLRKSGSGNIFIKNLPKSIDNKALHDICSAYGNILSCKVALDETYQSKGYGFVHYDTEEAADLAIQSLNLSQIGDSVVYVGHFVKKSERPAGEVSYTNLYIKNFPASWDEQLLKETFSTFGTITSLALRSNAKQQRFAFINFESPEQASAAIQALHGKKFKDDTLVMEQEEEQTNTENESKEQSEETFYVQPHQEKHQRQAQLKAQHETSSNVNGNTRSRAAGSNLYIKNFDSSVDDEALRNMFSIYGPISSAVVMRDDKGENLGFGFVNFVSQEDAVRAVTEKHNFSLHGKPLYVSTYEPKEIRRKRLGIAINNTNSRNVQNNPNMYPPYNGHHMQPTYAPPTGSTQMPYRHVPSFGSIPWRGSNNNNYGPQVTLRPSMGTIGMYQAHPVPSGMMSQTPPHQSSGGIVPTPQTPNSTMPNNGVMIAGTPTPPNNTPTQQLPPQNAMNIQPPNTPMNSTQNTTSSPVGNNTNNSQQQQQPAHANTQQQNPLMPNVATGNRNTPVMANSRVGPNFSSPVKKPPMQPSNNFGAGYKFTPQVRNQIEPHTSMYTMMDTINQNSMMSGANNTGGGPMMPPPLEANHSMPATISLQQLVAMTLPGQKQYLGEQLFYRITKMHPDLAGKITGMMLEMENEELLNLLNSDSQLHSKVQEALRVLQTHNPSGPN